MEERLSETSNTTGRMSEEKPVREETASGEKVSLKERLFILFVPITIALIQRIYGLTLRRINVGKERVEELRKAGSPWIYSIWHTNVFLSPYFHRGQGVHVLISASRDGELIHRVVRHFGNFSIRGSSSRGGIKALKQLIEVLASGKPAAITPDGPRGPAFVLQHGLIIAAQRSGVPVIPFHYEATRQWVAEKAWDKHRLPKPFSRVVCMYGEPFIIPRELSPDEFDRTVKDVEAKLLKNMEDCQAKVRELNARGMNDR